MSYILAVVARSALSADRILKVSAWILRVLLH